MTFIDWPWQQWVKQIPNSIALTTLTESFSWQQLVDKVDHQALYLKQQGVKPEQLVTVIAPNSVEHVVALLAIMQLGARYVGLNPRFSESEIDDIIEDLAVDYKINQSDLAVNKDQVCDAQDFPDLWAQWQPNLSLTLTLTSGSTGKPKAVVHSAETHLASAAGLLEKLSFNSGDNWLLSLPLFHVSGMAIIWRWLYRGATLMVCAKDDFDAALTQVTHASLVPTQLQRLLAEPSKDLQLKSVLLGGATIPVSLTDMAQQSGIDCWCGYGMTEMASTVTAKRADGHAGVGTVLPKREIRLVDGELWVKGETLALGYYQQGNITPVTNTPCGEWFATKDLGCFQDDQWMILGRKDNMFISGGENVQPEEIEKVLLSHPQVKQAYVVPVDDAEYGQRPVAVIEATADFALTELHDFMAERVTAFKRPISYFPLDSNLNSTGIKVSRQQLKYYVYNQHV